jgi:hypothetical protein
VDFTPELDKAKLLHGNRRGGELRLDEFDGATDAAGGNVALGEFLNGAQGEEIAEAVKALAPTGLRSYQAQTFPVAETARLKS